MKTPNVYTLMQTEVVPGETLVFFVPYGENKSLAQTTQKKFGGTLICHSADITFNN
jgi:hypothetical protein